MPTVNEAAVLVAEIVMMPLDVNPLTVNVSKVPEAGSEYVDVAVTPEKLRARANGSERSALKALQKETRGQNAAGANEIPDDKRARALADARAGLPRLDGALKRPADDGRRDRAAERRRGVGSQKAVVRVCG